MNTTSNTNQRKKRTGLFAALALVLCVAIAGGVFAWYSATAQRTNTFASGSITEPDKKPDPTDPTIPGNDNVEVKGNIQETKWVDSSKISANSVVAKNPNIGVGKGSDDSYVFVKVTNNLGKNTYFTLNSNWAPVSNQVVKYTGAGSNASTYVSGIFVYTGEGTAAKILKGDATKDVYTGELFSEIHANDSFTGVVDNAKTIDIKAYFGAKSSAGEELPLSDIQNAAIAKLNATN